MEQDTASFTILNREQMAAAIELARRDGYPCYVYGLCRRDTSTLFYCGKGRGFRVFAHEKEEANSHKVNILQKHGLAGYVLFSTHATDAEAYIAERLTIALHKPEANVLPGGEGFDSESAQRYAKAIHASRTPEERSAIAIKAHETISRNKRSGVASEAAMKAHETIRRKKADGQVE